MRLTRYHIRKQWKLWRVYRAVCDNRGHWVQVGAFHSWDRALAEIGGAR